jgi:hypothetical protein
MNKLDEIKARLAASTPGPWTLSKPVGGERCIGLRQDPPPETWNGMGYQSIGAVKTLASVHASKRGTYYGDMFHANGELIAHAPTDLAALVQAVEKVRAYCEGVRHPGNAPRNESPHARRKREHGNDIANDILSMLAPLLTTPERTAP